MCYIILYSMLIVTFVSSQHSFLSLSLSLTHTHTCTHTPVEAVETAEADLSSQRTRAKTEEDKMAKDQLIEVHSTVREMIKDETSELDMIKQQCIGDLQTIGE